MGDFFGDDELYLVDFRPFFTLGEEVVPRESGTIPAGTLVKIAQITQAKNLNRSSLGPQNNTWVHLWIAKDRGMVSFFYPKEHILVLPANITSKEQIKKYLAQILSKKDPNQWILPLASHIQEGIYKKRPIMGMNAEQLVAALGPAARKQYEAKSEFHEAQEIWEYPDYFIVMQEGTIRKIKSTKE